MDHGRVAGHDQRGPFLKLQAFAADHDGVACAQLLGLDDELESGFTGQLATHEIGAIAHDDYHPLDAGGADGIDHVVDHRPAANGHQNLGQLGAHPFAFARGQDDRQW